MRNLVCDIREEHRLRVFENKVVRRIFGPKRDEVTKWFCIIKSFLLVTLDILPLPPMS
jgi:hypothetical protein